MKAVILAGGEGTRLRPLTQETPKPLARILDRPVLSYTLAHLQKLGIREAALTTRYLSSRIRDYYRDEAFGVKLTYWEEETPLGTAGAVGAARDFLDDDFLVLSGDALFDFELSEAQAFWRETGAEAGLVLSRQASPLEYGVVRVSRDGSVLAFSEKPDWHGVCADTVNTGIYFCRRKLLERIPDKGASDFSRDIFPAMLAQGERISGYAPSGYWCDIGSPRSYYRCNLDALHGRVRLSVKPEGRFVGEGKRRSFLSDGARVSRFAQVLGSVVGAGCEVQSAQVNESVLGQGVLLADGVRVHRAVLCDGVQCQSGASVGAGSVLGPRVRVFQAAHVPAGQVLQADACVSEAEEERMEEAPCFSGETLCFPASGKAAASFAQGIGRALAALFSGTVLGASDGSAEAALLIQQLFLARAFAGADSALLPADKAPFPLWFTAKALGKSAVYCTGQKVFFRGADGQPLTQAQKRALCRAVSPGGESEWGGGRLLSLGESAYHLYEESCALGLPPLENLQITLAQNAASERLGRLLQKSGAALRDGDAKQGLFLALSEDASELRLFFEGELLADTHLARALLLKEAAQRETLFVLREPLPAPVEKMLTDRGATVLYPMLSAEALTEASVREGLEKTAYLYDALALSCRLFAFWQKRSPAFLPLSLQQERAKLPQFAVAKSAVSVQEAHLAGLLAQLWQRSEEKEALVLHTRKGQARLIARPGEIEIVADAADAEAAQEICSFAKTQINECNQKE